jgi:hypothetical protein
LTSPRLYTLFELTARYFKNFSCNGVVSFLDVFNRSVVFGIILVMDDQKSQIEPLTKFPEIICLFLGPRGVQVLTWLFSFAADYCTEGVIFLVCVFDDVDFKIKFAIGSGLVFVFLGDPVHNGGVILVVAKNHRSEHPLDLMIFILVFVFLSG